DRSSYWDPGGYRVVEWCCEGDGVEAYLLKEIQDGAPIRWFFTRSIPRARVQGLPAGSAPPSRDAPPPALSYENERYQFAERTDGTYEDEPGQRVPKTTWEYWDANRTRNLAVEVWADGRVECYQGAYIEPGEVELSAGAGEADEEEGEPAGPERAARAVSRPPAGKTPVAATLGVNPFLAAVVALPFAYLVPFFFGRPFDQCLAVAVPLAVLVGWGYATSRAPGAGWIGLLGLLAVGWVFAHYPPLGSPAGLATLMGAPLVIAVWGRKHGPRGRRGVVYLAALVVGLPAFVVGLYYYFSFAPGPHTAGQLVLALGPAALGAAGAMAIARLLLIGADGG